MDPCKLSYTRLGGETGVGNARKLIKLDPPCSGIRGKYGENGKVFSELLSSKNCLEDF